MTKRAKLSYHRNKSPWDVVKRIFGAGFWQIPWLAILYAAIYYARLHLDGYLNTYFGLENSQSHLETLHHRVLTIKNTLSLTDPLRYADYLTNLSAELLTNAKVSALKQSVRFLSDLTNGMLSLLWFLACIYAAVRFVRALRTRTKENDLANAVAEKLLPVFMELATQQSANKLSLPNVPDETNGSEPTDTTLTDDAVSTPRKK